MTFYDMHPASDLDLILNVSLKLLINLEIKKVYESFNKTIIKECFRRPRPVNGRRLELNLIMHHTHPKIKCLVDNHPLSIPL